MSSNKYSWHIWYTHPLNYIYPQEILLKLLKAALHKLLFLHCYVVLIHYRIYCVYKKQRETQLLALSCACSAPNNNFCISFITKQWSVIFICDINTQIPEAFRNLWITMSASCQWVCQQAEWLVRSNQLRARGQGLIG